METMRTPLCKNAAVTIGSLRLVLSVSLDRCYAQSEPRTTATPTKVAKLHEPGEGPANTDTGTTASTTPSRPAEPTEPGIPPAVARELEAMKLRILQLEAELKGRSASDQPPAPAATAIVKGNEMPAAAIVPAPAPASPA